MSENAAPYMVLLGLVVGSAVTVAEMALRQLVRKQSAAESIRDSLVTTVIAAFSSLLLLLWLVGT